MKIEDQKFQVAVLCRDCGAELNSTVEMTAKQIYDEWTRLVMSSGLVTGACKAGCRSTYSDLNINTNLVVQDAGTKKPIEFATFKLAFGHFYVDDHNDVCPHGDVAQDELYESRDYPLIHGGCGKFVKAYKPQGVS